MQIIQQSTDRLNKFESFRVDYFDKEKYWDDFQELVRRPVTGSLEFSDEAIVRLYDMTEGNPFFTKLLCIKIFERACDTRNSYISPDEVQFAIISCMDSLTMNNVNHFWKDGILEDEPGSIDIIETQRRKFLIAFAEVKRERNIVRKEDLISSRALEDVSTQDVLESFISRGVLVESLDSFRIKPRFFEKWLIEQGHHMMSKGFLDAGVIAAMERKEEEAYVMDAEIYELSESWGLYRGSQITETRIREWLNQFSNNIERRHMFKLLQNLRFYDELKIREKLRVIHESVRRGFLREIGEDERLRHDILLSSFGSLSKSGPSLARMYASENKVVVYNIAPPESVPEVLAKNDRIKAVVFIDDIIATGESAIENLESFADEFRNIVVKKEIKVVIATICGLSTGIQKVEELLSEMSFRIECKVADILGEEDQCFNEKAAIYTSKAELTKTREIAEKYGSSLAKRKNALGYNNSQLLVVSTTIAQIILCLLYGYHQVIELAVLNTQVESFLHQGQTLRT